MRTGLMSLMGKLRLLHCLETVGSGGVEQRRLTLARGLDPKHYEQRLVCTKAIGGLPPLFVKAGCPIHEVGVLKNTFDRDPYKNVLKIIHDFKPHIIHGAVFEGVSLAAVTGRLGKVPIIIGEETSDPQNRSWRGHVFYRMLCGLTHHMVGVSPAVVNYLVDQIHCPVGKVTLVNNGVYEAAPATMEQIRNVRAECGLETGHFVIGTVGRLLDNHKRVSTLIKAFAHIQAVLPDARLLIVGDGPDQVVLRNLCIDLKVDKEVLFAGYQSNPQPFYAVLDLFCLASAYEAFGLVLVEAMFSELPVVATRVGGIPAVVTEGETGLLVDPGEPEHLAHAILRFARDPDLCKTMGRQGKLKAVAQFSAERYVKEVDNLYQRLARERLG